MPQWKAVRVRGARERQRRQRLLDANEMWTFECLQSVCMRQWAQIFLERIFLFIIFPAQSRGGAKMKRESVGIKRNGHPFVVADDKSDGEKDDDIMRQWDFFHRNVKEFDISEQRKESKKKILNEENSRFHDMFPIQLLLQREKKEGFFKIVIMSMVKERTDKSERLLQRMLNAEF